MKNSRKIRGLLVMLIAFAFCFLAEPVKADDRTALDGIYVEDISVGGMTEEQITQAVNDKIEQLKPSVINLSAGEQNAQVTAGDLGLSCANPEVAREAVTIGHGAAAMQDLSEGGIFGALWEIADGAGIGLDVALKRIPIQQETVEICEFFGLNPYQMLSTGALLIAAADGEGLVQKMALEGIPSAVIGRTTSGKERILRNGEEVRYLDKPQMDEMYRVGR